MSYKRKCTFLPTGFLTATSVTANSTCFVLISDKYRLRVVGRFTQSEHLPTQSSLLIIKEILRVHLHHRKSRYLLKMILTILIFLKSHISETSLGRTLERMGVQKVTSLSRFLHPLVRFLVLHHSMRRSKLSNPQSYF